MLVEILSIHVGDPQVVVSVVGKMLCSVRCDESGTDPTVLADIDIDIDRPVQGERDIPLGDRVNGGRKILWYLLERSVGANQSVAASALPPPGPDKAPVVLILSVSLLLQTNSLPSRAGSRCPGQ